MFSALLREQSIRMVHGDNAVEHRVFSATFDILKDDPVNIANNGKTLVWSGLRFTMVHGQRRLDVKSMPPDTTEMPLEYLCCGMDAFGALKWPPV